MPEFAPFDRPVHSSVHLNCGVKQFLYLPETYSLHFETKLLQQKHLGMHVSIKKRIIGPNGAKPPQRLGVMDEIAS